MNSTGGFWLTCLATLCNLFVYVSCRPISLDQDRIGTSEWAADYEADDDQTTLGSEVTRRLDGQDDVPNAKELSYNGPVTGAPLLRQRNDGDSTAEDYYSPFSDQNCRFCDGEFDKELVDSVKSYGMIVLAITGVLAFMSLMFYALCCRCTHDPYCEMA